MAFDDFKTITFDDMVEYIEKEAPSFKKEFKEAALVENKHGVVRYNHIKAKYAFCKKFFPDLIPQKKPKAPNKTDILNEW